MLVMVFGVGSKSRSRSLWVMAGAITLLVFFVNATRVYANEIPTFRYIDSTKIVASGGYVETEMFNSSGQFFDSSIPSNYYDSQSRTVNFLFDRVANAFIFKGPFFTQSLPSPINGGEGGCWTGLQTTGGAGGRATFVGISNITGTVTTGCNDRIKEIIGRNDVVLQTAATGGEAVGENYLGVTIPACTQTPGTPAYNTCMIQRTAALDELASKINCSTGSAEQIRDCQVKKAVEICLRADETRTVNTCKATGGGEAILLGDYSIISAGLTNENIAALCQNTSDEQRCIELATAERDRLLAEGGGEGDITSTCGVEGIGWIVCPVMNFLARLNDLAFGILSSYFLEIETDLVDNDGTFRAWQAFRDIANALFIIAFLAIVYGQMVGGRN